MGLTQALAYTIDLNLGKAKGFLTNTEEVASFINNIIVRIVEEERYDKVVEEVVKKLKKNHLYVKPEKCKWKVKEVGLLKVVIRL